MSDIILGNAERGQLKFPVDTLKEMHLAIRGRIGQMKTLFLVYLLRQFLQLPDHAVVFIDLGGDQAATWLLYQAAQQANKPFYFFSLLPWHPSCTWDPIFNTPVFLRDPLLASTGIARGLNLLYGEGYGKSFWSRLNQAVLHQAMDNLRARGILLPTFYDVTMELRRMNRQSRASQHVSEAYLAAEQLLRYAVLTEKRSQQISLSQAIEEGACVMFYLPTALHSAASTAIASLAAWCVFVESSMRFDEGKSPRTIHLAIDEFAQIASGRSSFSSLLAMARKWGLQNYLCYQNDQQLITSDGDLTPIIRGLCQRIVFTCDSEDEITELRYQSLDVRRPDIGETRHGLSITNSVREVLDPGLTRNEIIELSAQKQKAYAVLKLGDKHRDPIPFTVIPPTKSKAEHEELKRRPFHDLPFPSGESEPVAVPPTPAAVDKKRRTHPARATAASVPSAQQAYQNVLADLKQELKWKMRSV